MYDRLQPVSDKERAMSEAWMVGGRIAERQERDRYLIFHWLLYLFSSCSTVKFFYDCHQYCDRDVLFDIISEAILVPLFLLFYYNRN